jgi:hypothetical protein
MFGDAKALGNLGGPKTVTCTQDEHVAFNQCQDRRCALNSGKLGRRRGWNGVSAHGASSSPAAPESITPMIRPRAAIDPVGPAAMPSAGLRRPEDWVIAQPPGQEQGKLSCCSVRFFAAAIRQKAKTAPPRELDRHVDEIGELLLAQTDPAAATVIRRIVKTNQEKDFLDWRRIMYYFCSHLSPNSTSQNFARLAGTEGHHEPALPLSTPQPDADFDLEARTRLCGSVQ